MKGRIIGVDYGRKRTGLSTTDPDQIIVTGLDTVDTKNFRNFLETYIFDEGVIKIVFGKPTHKDGTPTLLWTDIEKEISFLRERFPDLEIDHTDEAFTSADAKSIMLRSGLKKKKRRDKKTVDKLSAILILQKYLGHI